VRGVAVTLAGFALVAALLAWSRWLARRRLAALGHAVLAAACATLGAFLWAATDGLASFEPLRPGMEIAEIRFDDAGPGRYRATLVRLPGGRVQVFELAGERWRIEARTLEWRGPAASLGLQPACRLERLESAPAGEAETAAPAAAGRSYALADDAGMDLWARVRRNPGWTGYAEARVAGTPWVPMHAGMEFTVVATGRELVAEPAADVRMLEAPRR
jgi:hypothetical protein